MPATPSSLKPDCVVYVVDQSSTRRYLSLDAQRRKHVRLPQDPSNIHLPVSRGGGKSPPSSQCRPEPSGKRRVLEDPVLGVAEEWKRVDGYAE